MRANPHPISLAIKNTDPLAARFEIPVEDCDVPDQDKPKLNQYRTKWKQWMSWYGYGSSEPHSIQQQIHQMLFSDITYRAAISVRESVSAGVSIAARSPTLAYLLDLGYVLSQVLALQKLLDERKDVISVKRLLKDVRKYRGLITRENYVAGTGLPYDYSSWSTEIDQANPMVRMWGIDAPGLVRFATSKYLHETFDTLSGKREGERQRKDTIPRSIFDKLEGWISGPNAREIEEIRNNFIAHAPDSIRLGSFQFKGVSFAQIDDLQRAIVRVERALTDHILAIRIGRGVVPSPPLGIFRGLDLPYSNPESERGMHRRWNELSKERERWKDGVLQELTSISVGA